MSFIYMENYVKKITAVSFLFLSLTLLADSRKNRVLSQLSSDNWLLQAEALDYAGRFKVIELIPQIEKILSQKNNGWIRGEALKSLAKISPEKTGLYVKKYMNDPEESVKTVVARLCLDLPEKTATPIINVLIKGKGQASYHALVVYSKQKRQNAWTVAAPKLNKIPSNSVEPAVRAMAYIANEQSLQKIKSLINSLIKQQKSGQDIYRGLTRIKNTKLISLLFDLANLPKAKKSKHQKTPVPESNISLSQLWHALKVFEKDQLASELNKLLATPVNVRIIAQLMAAHINTAQLQKKLVSQLEKTTDPNVLTFGLSALGKDNPDQFKDLFIKNLNHQDIKVKITSLICIGQCKTVDHFKVLKASLEDNNPEIRNRALSFLAKADPQKVPKNVIEYFKSSLFSKDQVSRKVAIAAIIPHLNRQNAEANLTEFHKFLDNFETAEFRPLMTALYPLLPEEKSKELLIKMGYITDWHVIGSFPHAFVSPDKERDGFEFVYPPEERIDLTEKITVKYNKYRAHRREIVQQDVAWDKVSVRNEDAILYMSKARDSLLIVTTRNGVSYAYTEIIVSEKMSSELRMFVDEMSKQKVWLNGKLIPFEVDNSLRKVFRRIDKKLKSNLVTKTSKVELKPGKNSILIKVHSNDGTWIGQVTSKRFFNFSVLDPKGKALKWSHK